MSPQRDSPIKNDLLSDSRTFSFFQAVRLLCHPGLAGTAVAGADIRRRIRVRPDLSLGFPSADIHSIEIIGDPAENTYRLTTTFLGLYGTASPLPTFYTEDLLDEASQDQAVSREFLDLFNQRLYTLLYEGWLKYRLFSQVAEERNPSHADRLYCLMGLGAPGLRPTDSGRLLRYIGLFSQQPHSAAGLAAILGDALAQLPVEIVPCVPRMAAIPESQQLKMGVSGSSLGVDSFLGEEIEDRMGKFRIRIGPLHLSDFLRFIPGRPDHQTVISLTELYVTEPLAYDVELVLAAGQAQTACLGDPVRSALGVTTWVFSEPALGEVSTRFEVKRR